MMMVGVIALIVFGPNRLPEIARSIGKAITEFRRQANDIRSEFQSGFEDDETEDEKPVEGPKEPADASQEPSDAPEEPA